MKAYYNPEGEPCWIDQEVDVVAWDGDKYFTYKDSLGELHTAKRWQLSIKRSNKVYKLPRGYMDNVDYPTNKEVAEELKELRKRKVEYTAYVLEGRKNFTHLHKALNFCKSAQGCSFLRGSFSKKHSSLFTPLLTKEEDGLWYYSSAEGNVSNKTLDRWVMSIKTPSLL